MNPEPPPRVYARAVHRYSARPERVFDAWLDTDLLGKWMFGPAVRDEEVLRMVIDPRVGGTFSFLVRRQGREIDHVGTYREIDRPRRLAFTWGVAGESAEESLVVIDIVPVESGCEVTLTHDMDPKWADYVSRIEAGWTKILDQIAAALD